MLKISTQYPQSLLDAIKKAIKDKKIETWECDDDGDFTHTAASGQWRGKGWLRPEVEVGALNFRFVPPEKMGFNVEVYGVYLGRFTEMLLAHFPDNFTSAVSTPRKK